MAAIKVKTSFFIFPFLLAAMPMKLEAQEAGPLTFVQTISLRAYHEWSSENALLGFTSGSGWSKFACVKNKWA